MAIVGQIVKHKGGTLPPLHTTHSHMQSGFMDFTDYWGGWFKRKLFKKQNNYYSSYITKGFTTFICILESLHSYNDSFSECNIAIDSKFYYIYQLQMLIDC